MPTFGDRVVPRLLDALHLKKPVRQVLEATPLAALLRSREVRQRPRLVIEAALNQTYADALAVLASEPGPLGDYLEFGVFNGTSLLTMQKAFEAAGNKYSRLIGFDSFEGLPDVAVTDCGGHWKPGEFRCSLDFTRRVLDYEGADWNRIHLVKGYFSSTLTSELTTTLAIQHASLIMVDCDLYQSAKEALAFCTPLIQDRAVVLFDDWYPLADRGMGEKPAFEEWLADNPTLTARELWNYSPHGKVFIVRRR